VDTLGVSRPKTPPTIDHLGCLEPEDPCHPVNTLDVRKFGFNKKKLLIMDYETDVLEDSFDESEEEEIDVSDVELIAGAKIVRRPDPYVCDLEEYDRVGFVTAYGDQFESAFVWGCRSMQNNSGQRVPIFLVGWKGWGLRFCSWETALSGLTCVVSGVPEMHPSRVDFGTSYEEFYQKYLYAKQKDYAKFQIPKFSERDLLELSVRELRPHTRLGLGRRNLGHALFVHIRVSENIAYWEPVPDLLQRQPEMITRLYFMMGGSKITIDDLEDVGIGNPFDSARDHIRPKRSRSRSRRKRKKSRRKRKKSRRKRKTEKLVVCPTASQATRTYLTSSKRPRPRPLDSGDETDVIEMVDDGPPKKRRKVTPDWSWVG